MALAKCVLTDIAAKKRGPTKSAAAGMLRVAVRCAEDVRLSGKLNKCSEPFVLLFLFLLIVCGLLVAHTYFCIQPVL
jgi:hypothetical protein